jgi:hypothetical protein
MDHEFAYASDAAERGRSAGPCHNCGGTVTVTHKNTSTSRFVGPLQVLLTGLGSRSAGPSCGACSLSV